MQINIYWGDLSREGKKTMIENGFFPTSEQEKEIEPIGQIDTEQKD